jgi:hypothetical protein
LSSIDVDADIDELSECTRRIRSSFPGVRGRSDDERGLATALLSDGVTGVEVRRFHRDEGDGDGESKERLASRSSE